MCHCRKGCCDLKIQRFRAAIFLETLDGRCYEFSCRWSYGWRHRQGVTALYIFTEGVPCWLSL